MNDVCHYKLVGGQFCGGYFWEIECRDYLLPLNIIENKTTCSECGKQLEIVEDDDE